MPAGPGSVAPLVRPRAPELVTPSTPALAPRVPQRDGKPFIPIPLEASRVRPTHSTPWAFWSHYYKPNPDPKRDHDEPASKLRETVTLLNWNKKFADAEAALKAYLIYRPKNQEPWMYQALALAIQENKGKPEEIKQSLDYAADLAQRSHNPNLLISVADQLYLHDDLGRVGALLDEAAEKVPHRSEPLIMSIMLASKTKDPKRMAASVESLLSLGWPGNDDLLRRDVRLHVERLAKLLHEDGRAAEADALLAKLPESEARDLFIRLSWTGDADLDLVVEEPLGATANYQAPRTVFGGSLIKNGYGKHPEEVYVCPRAFDGEYKIRINVIYNDSKIRSKEETAKNPERPATQAILEIITHDGAPDEHKQTLTIPLGEKPPAPVVVNLKGGRRKTVLPYLAHPNNTATPEVAGRGGRNGAAKPENIKTAKPKP